MMTRAKNVFGGRICNKECPKALGVYSPSDPVSFRSWCFSNLGLCEYTSWFSWSFCCLCVQHREGIY
jgi:hypothetical protein